MVEIGIKNRGDRIRTCGLVVPNDALYQAEPHPVVKNNESENQFLAQRPERSALPN